MDNTTSSALTIINNFDLQTILNFNIYVFLNIIIYFAAASFGIKIAIEITKVIVKLIHYKWTSRYERRAKEIEELNRKMHDRLVEIEDAVNNKEIKIDKAKVRLRYNASRLKKYDQTIYCDVADLLSILDKKDKLNESVKLIEQIRKKVDELYFKKG